MDRTNTFLDTHLDALKLEIDLIDKIMIRNRCSHGKAKYFRFLDMACTFLRKSKVLELYDEVTGLLKEIPERSKSYKTKRKREQIFWEFQPSKEKAETNDNDELDQFSERLDRVANCVARQLPLCLSRFVYASKFFFLEISRGFFLPFCVVTVGAIARTRALLEQLGRFVLQECWNKLARSWTEFRDLHGAEKAVLAACTVYKEDFQKARNSFALPEQVDYNATLSKVDRAAAILRILDVRIPLSSKGKKEEERTDPNSTELSVIPGKSSRVVEDDCCDHGEVVVSSATSAQMNDVAFRIEGDTGSASGLGTDPDRVDRNSEILEKMKGKKKMKEKRPVSETMDASKPKKKRKAKAGKKESGDFFDDLFSR